MKKNLLAAIFVFSLAGCVSSPPPTAPKQTAVQANWQPLLVGSNISTDVNYPYYPKEMKLSNGMLLRGEKWDGYLKTFVTDIPSGVRDTVIDGMSRYYHEFDKVDNVIRFEPRRYMKDLYSEKSFVSVKGSISKNKAIGLLMLQYHGDSWIFADSIKVVADGQVIEFNSLKFNKESYRSVWEYTFLDLSNPKYRELADKIAGAKEVIIRFRGPQYYSDLTVSAPMQSDLRAMLATLDALKSR